MLKKDTPIRVLASAPWGFAKYTPSGTVLNDTEDSEEFVDVSLPEHCLGGDETWPLLRTEFEVTGAA